MFDGESLLGGKLFNPQERSSEQEIPYALQIFQLAIDSLDNIEVEMEDEGSDSFTVSLGNVEAEDFPVGKVSTRKLPRDESGIVYYEIEEEKVDKEKKQTQTIIVRINPKNFTFQDVPKLVKEIQQEHETSMRAISGNDAQTEFERRLLINPAEVIARRYLTIAKLIDSIIEEFPELQENQQTNGQASSEETVEEKSTEIKQQQTNRQRLPIIQTHGQQLQEITNYLKQIAGQYNYELDQIDREALIPDYVRERIRGILIKERKPNSKRDQSIERLFRISLKQQFEMDMYQPAFERSAKEILRLAGLEELLNDFETKGEYRAIQDILEQTGNLERMNQLRMRLEGTEDNHEKAKIQIEIASLVNMFIYSQDYFVYKQGHYKPGEVAKSRYVQCMTIAYLQKIIWEEFFGQEILGDVTESHFFSILPLADGTYLINDGELRRLTKEGDDEVPIRDIKQFNIDTNYEQERWFVSGNFEEMYLFGLLYWEVLEKLPEDVFFAEKILLECLHLNQTNPLMLFRIASFYNTNQEHFFHATDKAERYYLQGLWLNPTNIDFYGKVISFYQDLPGPEPLIKLESLIQKILLLNTNDIFLLTELKNLYNNNVFEDQPEKLEKVLLKLMELKPGDVFVFQELKSIYESYIESFPGYQDKLIQICHNAIDGGFDPACFFQGELDSMIN